VCAPERLNPLGFVTENFAAMGRARTAQRFSTDNGMPLRLKRPGARDSRLACRQALVPGGGGAAERRARRRSGRHTRRFATVSLRAHVHE